MPLLTYLGSASQYPSPKRALNSLFLKFSSGKIWLFDCGESTQTQFLKANGDPSQICKIFISHLHGDHCYGLPTMLLRISESKRLKMVKIFGPVGLAEFIKISLTTSNQIGKLSFEYKVVEAYPLEYQFKTSQLLQSNKYLEFIDKLANSGDHNSDQRLTTFTDCCKEELKVESSTQIDPNLVDQYCLENNILRFNKNENSNGQFIDLTHEMEVEDKELENASILKSCFLVPLIHTVPSFGYVFIFKNMTIMLFGDCCSSDLSLNLLNNKDLFLANENDDMDDNMNDGDNDDDNADSTRTSRPSSKRKIILVHEATLDDSLKSDAITKGHSCPSMVAEFVKKISLADCSEFVLVLNHFSQRYVDDSFDEPKVTAMTGSDDTTSKKAKNCHQPKTSIMVKQAKEILVEDKFKVYAARDLWSILL